MDGVIELLQECSGAIILGYPQILVTAGQIKDKIINTEIVLGTEWNHIEAGLAYASNLPVLVIHDTRVIRGIFDRGVLNSFLYSKDFTEKSWPINADIIGAISKWKNKLGEKGKIGKLIQQREKYQTKWGCLLFEGYTNYYCPVCYTKDGLKILTSRIDTKFRECPNCKARLA